MGIFYQIFNFVTMSVRIGDEKISLAFVHSSISSSDHSLTLGCITVECCLHVFYCWRGETNYNGDFLSE